MLNVAVDGGAMILVSWDVTDFTADASQILH